jgi:hypothetical protein
MLSVKSDIIGFYSLRRGAVSTCTPLPKDPIFISAAPPKRADTGRILTTRAPTLGRRIAGHSVGAGPCPRRANAISSARTAAVPVLGNRRQTCRNGRAGIRFVLGGAGNSLFLPVLATKIPCSGWSGNLCLIRWNRCANRPSTSAGWREKAQIPCYFPCYQGNSRLKNPEDCTLPGPSTNALDGEG